MSKIAIILACVLVLVAGCKTAPQKSAKSRPPDWELVPIEKHVPPPALARAIPTPAPEPETATTWISLNRWGQQCGFGPITRLSQTPVETYALPTPKGVLVFTIGSLVLHWDGVELRLGFAPQIIDGQVFIHGLDARKNLEPLLNGSPVTANVNRVIVIDPGHGGGNTGTKSVVDGRFEKEFTLDWALRLAPLLEQKGWRVFLTRTNDSDVSLADRVTFAEQHQADFFLSLHFNSAAPAREPTGLETYCLTPVGMPSSIQRGEDDLSQVFPNNAFDEQNLQYAVRLHRALLAVNGHEDRGVGHARFIAVLRGQHRPAVLVEGGYLSNPREARQIEDPAYRQKLAEAVAKALE